MRPRELLEKLGRGASPEELRIKRGATGLLDLRGIDLSPFKEQPGEPVELGPLTVPGEPVSRATFEDLVLDRVDMTRANLEHSLWAGCTFRNILFNRVRAYGANFATSSMESVSFERSDLRRSNWGEEAFDGPLITGARFMASDLRDSTFSHPLFRSCWFENCNLRGVNFAGARFETCTFSGMLDTVQFHGHYYPAPGTVALRNKMEHVDFTQASLTNVLFCRGIDITTCRFPSEGYLCVTHPRATYERLVGRAHTDLSGEARETAIRYLDALLRSCLQEDQPLHLVRLADLRERHPGGLAGEFIASELSKFPRAGETG